MSVYFDTPIVVLAIALVAQAIAAYIGDFLRKRAHSFKQGERHDFNVVQAATLTLLALIIGFSFSMAVSRYDQRKTLEEAEANAIGTEYLRADLLPGDGASRTRELLKKYIDLRIAFYEERNAQRVAEIGQQTGSTPAASSSPSITHCRRVGGRNLLAPARPNRLMSEERRRQNKEFCRCE